MAVLDGHGGPTVAQLVQNTYPRILRELLLKYDKASSLSTLLRKSIDLIDGQIKMNASRSEGSTFCGMLLDLYGKVIHVVNIGDSRAIQLDPPAFITTPHKPGDHDETARIKESNGIVINGRVGGVLAVSRALGDYEMRPFGIVSTPDIREWEMRRGVYALASDGVWDWIDAPKFAEVVAKVGTNNLEAASKLIV